MPRAKKDWTVEQRLRNIGWSETDNGCWEWNGAKSGGSKSSPGVGRIGISSIRKAPLSVTRLAYELWVGQIPDGMEVLHKCRNQSCLNPDHLTVDPNEIPISTERVCPRCRAVMDAAASGWCRRCKAMDEAERRRARGIPLRKFAALDGSLKTCMQCGVSQPLANFSPSSRGSGGVSSYCRACINNRKLSDPNRRAKARSATAKHRREHRESHLASHRVRMFERRALVKVSMDGSVTEAFLVALYAESICYYCGMDTNEGDRTAEHVIPLSRGGMHVASNLVMACLRCNSAKRDMSEDEYRERVSRDST